MLIDLSIVLGGYRCDVANTFRCGAAPTDAQRHLHQLCMEAMEAGLGQLRHGSSAAEVDAAARGCFERAGVAADFPHHTGHGIGLGHPEAPFLLPESRDHLVAGNVVTIEPGLYSAESGGMRFERNILITEGTPEILTGHLLSMDQDG